MSCNQQIISCKSVIHLLLRHHCRNSQFLFPSPFYLIIEEERACEGVTQLNSRQKKPLPRYKISILVPHLVSELQDLFWEGSHNTRVVSVVLEWKVLVVLV